MITKINQVLNALASTLTQDMAIDLINGLSHGDRITVRNQAQLQGLALPRNLYFDYSTQEWIK